MHIEIYIIRVELSLTGERREVLLAFEVGETLVERDKLVGQIKKELPIVLGNRPHKILGFICKKAYPKES